MKMKLTASLLVLCIAFFLGVAQASEPAGNMTGNISNAAGNITGTMICNMTGNMTKNLSENSVLIIKNVVKRLKYTRIERPVS
jgi:hypothetical protein